MTKRELVIAAFEAMRDDYPALTTTLGTVEKTLEVLCGVAAAELLGGGEVPLPGIGKLKAKTTAARKGRNPRTGESVDIPAGKKVRFVACKDLKEALKQ